MDENEYKKLLVRASGYCSKAEKAPLDVMKKLDSWSKGQADYETKSRIIETLKDEGFLDEERYLNAFINDKVFLGKKGPFMIRTELRMKGLNDRLIESALRKVKPEQWRTLLEEYLLPRMQHLKAKNSYEFRDKACRSGVSRGYEYDMVAEVVDDLMRNHSFDIGEGDEDY